MTWFEERIQTHPSQDVKIKLLVERELLEKQIKDLNSSALGKSESALRARKEDLLSIAKKIVAIDKKLGRI